MKGKTTETFSLTLIGEIKDINVTWVTALNAMEDFCWNKILEKNTVIKVSACAVVSQCVKLKWHLSVQKD